ncbi:hypothetical protein DPQ31_26635 [Bacillus sp. COPE52]|nr:hypothetical protein DPQ31_26635 [Bacillus sp. COPE52]
MMNIEICKWFNNSDSPVMFMIDDLANVWVDTTKSGELELGEDWGYWKNEEKSSFRYLNEVILKNFPEVKVTFFVPVGVRVGMVKNPVVPSISERIDNDNETKKFFREIHEDNKFEIAYHGTTHGRVGSTNLDFKQEWELFNDLEEAIVTIEKGKQIFRNAIGVDPVGGKYCGYTSNGYSDSSIDKTGFLWWCRYWNKGIEEETISNITGEDKNSLTNFDVKFFGERKVIDIPSTVNGALLTSIFNYNKRSVKGITKHFFKKYLIKKKLTQINQLLDNKLIISIQEHIAPSRDDGRRQAPNIFDDKKSLRTIFRYLQDKNVWYCTGSELSDYVRLRESIKIELVDKSSFRINSNLSQNVTFNTITLKVDLTSRFKIMLPNKEIVESNVGIVNIPVLAGNYTILA